MKYTGPLSFLVLYATIRYDLEIKAGAYQEDYDMLLLEKAVPLESGDQDRL